MQFNPINPINPINLINPIAETPAVSPVPAVGVRNQTDTTQTNSENRPAIFLKPKDGEIRLTVPPERAPEAEEALRKLGDVVKESNISLNFSRDEETGTIVVKLVDQTSGTTVQQIPSEALLHLAATLGKLQGQLFDRKA